MPPVFAGQGRNAKQYLNQTKRKRTKQLDTDIVVLVLFYKMVTWR